MKLVGRHLEKDGSGYVALIPEEPEDLWHAYHLLAVGDVLRSTTIRKVKSETTTGSVDSQKVRTTLSVEVASVEFDVAGCMLRVNGRNVEENQFVRMGAFHTIEMELHRKFSIQKQCWDEIAMDRVAMACDASARADVAAVIMQEGLAYVCLVTPHMTLVKAKIDMPIPRKRKGAAEQQAKAMTRFFGKVMEAIVTFVNFEVVKCVLVASPGFVREQFCSFLFSEATRTDCKKITENRSKFLQIHSSSGFVHALKEVLEDPAVASLLADTKAASEVQALKDFHVMLNTDPDRAYYGLPHVTRAAALQAVATLLITDELFRSANVDERRHYVKLVQDVRDSGGSIKIFSSLHVSGEQLALLSGVAAILRYPLPEIEEESADVPAGPAQAAAAAAAP
eukprot:m.62469 g.62469  ORF g.62469 m.62469 type:complete len:395 (+) comp12406_c0_seq2:157-1341(+)